MPIGMSLRNMATIFTQFGGQPIPRAGAVEHGTLAERGLDGQHIPVTDPLPRSS